VSGVAVWTESARPSDRCVLCVVCVGVCRAADALRRRTQLSGSQFTEPYKTIDKTAAPVSRPPPPRRRPGRPLRLAARPPTRSDVVRHAKCKHAVDCCIWLNLNFFTKRHATKVIYVLRLCLAVSRLNSHRLTRHRYVLSCLVLRAVWIGHYAYMLWPHSSDRFSPRTLAIPSHKCTLL